MLFEFNLFLISWFFTHLEPLQEKIHNWFSYWDQQGFITKPLSSIYEILTCFYCFSFWFTLVLTMNPLTAMLVSFFAFTYKTLLENVRK